VAERSAVEVLRIAGIDGIAALEQLLVRGRAESAEDEWADEGGLDNGGSGAEDSAPPMAE
jgi:hypothetical protein